LQGDAGGMIRRQRGKRVVDRLLLLGRQPHIERVWPPASGRVSHVHMTVINDVTGRSYAVSKLRAVARI
jgi:hypothetical protein